MFIFILTMCITLDAHGDYVEFYSDEDGVGTARVYLDPGGPPRRVRTWRAPSQTPQVFDPRPIEEWM